MRYLAGIGMEHVSKVRGTWVQTERKAHEKWAALVGSSPRSAQLLHLLVANMNKRGALVASQKTLAEMMGMSRETVKRALVPLKEGNWIDIVRVGSPRGGVNMYCVNRRVAWADKRENQKYAPFDARVILSADEQDIETLENKLPLQQLPRIGEHQIPSGEGEAPPSQPILKGIEPDLPATPDSDGDIHRQKTLL